MTPYNDTNIIKEIIYVVIWFMWAIISIIYGMLNKNEYTFLSSLWMVMIGGFIGWIVWVWTDSNLLSAIGWAMSLEIMHIIKQEWPEIIKQKMKDFFKIK